MQIQNKYIQRAFEHAQKVNSGKDRQQLYHVIDQNIRQLSAEIVRLSRLSYSSWKNMEKIRSLDDQIRYLEEVMAAFERDAKKL